MKVMVRRQIRKFLFKNGESDCYEIFSYLKANMSGRIAPANPKAVGSICARNPDIKTVGKRWAGKHDVMLYDLKDSVRRAMSGEENKVS